MNISKKTKLILMLIALPVCSQAAIDSTLTNNTDSKGLLNNIQANEFASNTQYITNNTANSVKRVYNPITGKDITETYWPGYEKHIGKRIALDYCSNPDTGSYKLEAFVDDDGRPNVRIHSSGKNDTLWSIGEFYGVTARGVSNLDCNAELPPNQKPSYPYKPKGVKW